MSSFILQEYSNINKNRNIISKDLPHISRFNFNNKNVKLSILPHSFSQSNNIHYQQQSNSIPRIYPEKIKNIYNFYDKENSKKSESTDKTSFNNFIEIKDLIGKNSNKPIEVKMLSENITKFNPGKISSKSFGIITSYAANTNQGIVRNYNEDRVSIIINMNKPDTYNSTLPWPKISYFAIFDGHAGNKCAEYLRENLLKLICSNIYFPENIPEAIRYGFEKADEQFLNNYAMVNGQLKDNSGTCGLILLIINNEVYIGNVGDSRCIGSFNNGKNKRDITRDHKPNTPYERERIIANGGQIYQTKTHIKVEENLILKNKILLGPHRVFPGRLSVSRTVGDAEGKIPILGGNPNVIICKPDIYKFNIIDNDIDYFILGCDGIFDQLTSKDVFKCVSLILERNKELSKKIEYNKINKNEYKSLYGDNIDIHTTSGDIVDLILKASMIRQSYDNVTCLLVSFKNLFNINFQINNGDTLENSRNNIELYTSIKRDPNLLLTSNSSKSYHRNNSNNKKNINIHGISKLIQKLRSGNSDSSLFKKKEEMVIANEVNEYSGKPMAKIYKKNNNTIKKENSISHLNSAQSNSSINITFGNNHSNNINNNIYDYKEEKKNTYIFNKNDEDKEYQIIYKNKKYNNFLNNQNNMYKSNTAMNTSNSFDNGEIEDKKGKLFYNRKKINLNKYKKKNESSDLKYENENKKDKEREKEKEKEKENNKETDNKRYAKNNSRNIYSSKNKDSLNINSFIYRNNNSLKSSFKNDSIDNINESSIERTKISPSIKKLYNNKIKYCKNNIDINNSNSNSNNNKINKDIINNNFLTETKLKTNKVFNNLVKNKSNKLNLLKDFNNINIVESSNYSRPIESKNNLNNTVKNYKDTDKNSVINKNSSFQSFKAFKSLGIKKIFPLTKISYNIKDDKNSITEYNNHKYYYSNNNTNDKSNKHSKNQKFKEKFDTFNMSNHSIIKNNEPRNSNTRNYNEIKLKYSSQMRSNTECNYKDKQY